MLAVRSERALTAALGPSHLGARPLQREAVRALAAQLLEHWRELIPVVSPRAGEGRTTLAVALARKLAGILFAIWRDGTTYEPKRAAQRTAPM